MGFSTGYLEGVEKGRFGASRERCLKTAEYFELDPNEILALAGIYVPPAETPSIVEEIAAEASELPALAQRLMLQIVRALKTQAVQRRQPAERDYHVQADGDTLSIRLPPEVNPEEVVELLQRVLEQLY